jgi:hypothetical protein
MNQQQQQFVQYTGKGEFNPIGVPSLSEGMANVGETLYQSMINTGKSALTNRATQLKSIQQEEENLEKLSEFSETASKFLIERQKEQNERDKLAGLNKAYAEGIPDNVQEAFTRSLQQLNDNEANSVEDINDAVENQTISYEMGAALRGMSPWTQVGYSQGILKQLGESYPLQQQSELMEAIRQNPNMSLNDKIQALEQYRENWMVNSGLLNFNDAFLNEFLFPQMRDSDQAILNQWRSEELQNQRDLSKQDGNTAIQNGPSQSNWDTSQALYRAAGLSRAESRVQALSQVTDTQTLDAWAGLMSFDGKTPLGIKFKKEFNAAYARIQKNAIDANTLDDNEKALAARAYADPLIEQWTVKGKPVTEKDLQEAKARSTAAYGVYDPRLDNLSFITKEKQDEKYWQDIVDRAMSLGLDMSPYINNLNIPWSVRKNISPGAGRLKSGAEVKDAPQIDQLESDIENVPGMLEGIRNGQIPYDSIKLTPGIDLAKGLAADLFIRAYNKNRLTMSESDAATQAYIYVKQQIDQGNTDVTSPFWFSPKEGFIKLIRGMDGTPEARLRKERAALASQQAKAIETAFANAGPNRQRVLDTKILLTEDQLTDAIENSGTAGYEVPYAAKYISTVYFGGRVSPWEILQIQAKAFKGVDIQLPNAARREAESDPEIKRLLNTYPSYNRRSRGIMRMTTVTPRGANPSQNADEDPYVGQTVGEFPEGGDVDPTASGQGGPEWGFDPSFVPHHYGFAVSQAANAHGVDPAVLAGLIEQESRWDKNAVSPAGAQGLAQFMPATAREFGVDVNDPISSIYGAAKYLRYLMDYFNGDLELALYAYNGGMGNVEYYNGPIPGNRENTDYAPGVLERAAKFGYQGYVPGLNPAIRQLQQ